MLLLSPSVIESCLVSTVLSDTGDYYYLIHGRAITFQSTRGPRPKLATVVRFYFETGNICLLPLLRSFRRVSRATCAINCTD